MIEQENSAEATFWDHLDELRKVLFRILAVVVFFMLAAFLCKEWLFDVVLAPSQPNFVTYRLFCHLATAVSLPQFCPETFRVELINTELASQFLVHMSVSFYIGVLIAFPYVIYQLFSFVSPALRANERRYSGGLIGFSVLLFVFGVLLNYFIIFPFSFRFLATYQVSSTVANMINLSSYIDTMLLLSVMIGLMAELPVLSWFLAKLGLIDGHFMRKYRRYAVVLIVVVSAIITPTTDVFTLLLVFVPIYALYELSIKVVD